MATNDQMATAILTEHFRYTPLTLLDDIINMVNELVFRAINAIEEGLNNTSAESLGFRASATDVSSEEARRDALQSMKQNEIDNGIVKLESLLNATVDKDFDKFEIYSLRNILAVGHEEEDLASWMQLDHYKNLDLTTSPHAPTPDQVQMQRRKLQETAKLNSMLKEEEARNTATLAQLHGLIGQDGQENDIARSPFGFLATSMQASNGQALGQNTQYAVSQLPAMSQLLAELKDSLQRIPQARSVRLNHDAFESKRKDYMESRAARALQRRAIEPEHPDKIAAMAGRKISKDEIEGIEAVLHALEGAE